MSKWNKEKIAEWKDTSEMLIAEGFKMPRVKQALSIIEHLQTVGEGKGEVLKTLRDNYNRQCGPHQHRSFHGGCDVCLIESVLKEVNPK